jgi:antitoxin HigA-1
MGGASGGNSAGGVPGANAHLPYRLSVALRVSPPTVNDIVREKRGITPEMSLRLAKYFGTSEQFWLNLQDAFAVHQVKEKLGKELKAIRPLATAASR